MLTKKTQLLMLVAALSIPFAAHANDIGGTAADPDDNQEFQDVPKATDPIVIDGDLSEWTSPGIVDPLIGIPKIGRDDRVEGDPPSQFVVHEELGGTWTGPDDQSSTTHLAWDDTGLYIGVIVTDDYHENAANSPWNGDSFQMMITDENREEFALYNYALGGIEVDHEGFEEDPPLPPEELFVSHERGFPDFFSDLDYLLFNEATDDAAVAIHRDTIEKKTTYEIFLGTEALGVEVEEMVAGTQLGLAFAINDGDEGEGQNGQKGWVGLGAHAIVFGKTSTEAALLTLVDEIVPPMEEFLEADFNEDGIVDFSDFLVLSTQFNQTVDPPGTDPDINGNGIVDFPDFLVLSTQFNMTSGGAAQVPEPSSLGLLGFSVLFLGFLRRRRSG